VDAEDGVMGASVSATKHDCWSHAREVSESIRDI
jgi:hypothetical protein